MKYQSEVWTLFFSVSAQMFLIWTFCRPDVLWAELVWGGWCHRWACSLLQQWHHWCIPQTLPLSLLCVLQLLPSRFQHDGGSSCAVEVQLTQSHNPTQTSQLHIVCAINSWCYVVHIVCIDYIVCIFYIVCIVYIICFIHVVYVVWSLYNFSSYSIYKISCM